MAITNLEVRGLTSIEQADFDFVPGINVFIGENGTGKTHVLKSIYSILRALPRKSVTEKEIARHIKDYLVAVFRPDDDQVGRLVRFGMDDASLWLCGQSGEVLYTISERGEVEVADYRDWQDSTDALFLPSREVLAMFEGFVAAYDNRELSFDKTYYDVCVALSRTQLRGPAGLLAEQLSAPFKELLGGDVVLLDGRRFYVNLGDAKREAHLVAEGLRKLATLAHLVQNGSLKRGSVLLWDEPESNLNPRIIAKLADLLPELASQGVQIFIATHDYLLAHRLSVAAEYGVAPNVAMRFFSFHHEKPTDPVVVDTGETLADIQENPILDAYAGHHDYEQELFHRELEDEEKNS